MLYSRIHQPVARHCVFSISEMNTVVPPAEPLDCAETPPTTTLDLRVFLAYENMASALHAAETLAAVSRRDPDGFAVQLSPWSFAALENSDWRAQAAPYVERAHLIVIAACSALPPLSSSMEEWLKTLLVRRHAAHPAIVVIFERDTRLDRGGGPRLQSVRRLAQAAGCAFFTPVGAEEIARLV